MMAPPPSTYVIVGAGAFGASTALHLRREHPAATVLLVDRMVPDGAAAASSDLNKIIRADYTDPAYMQIAREAKAAWREDPIWKVHYHEPGMLFADDAAISRTTFDTYKRLGIASDATLLTPEESLARFGQYFGHANWNDVPEFLHSPRAGWADADAAMQALHRACSNEGVQFVNAMVTMLRLSDGTCSGVILDDGRVLPADFTLVCTGALTAKLLADSDAQNPKIHVGRRLVAAAAASCAVRCKPEFLHLYQDAPIHIIAVSHTSGECIPPNKDGLLKFNFEVGFTNIEDHVASNQQLSVPVRSGTWGQDVPVELKEKLRTVIDNIWGPNAPGLEPHAYRLCWDSITPDEEFLITPHPHCANLYIAAGGSFHAWKFLPVIGKYVVQMLQGTLDPSMARRWAWDRSSNNVNPSTYFPRHDLKNISG